MKNNNEILLNEFTRLYTEEGALNYAPDRDYERFTDVYELLAQRGSSKVKFKKDELAAIEKNFHNLMRYRCRGAESATRWLRENRSILPKITNNLMNEPKVQWFAVGGMYGGFAYIMVERKGKPILMTDSWFRISLGSGEQHEITPNKVHLLVKGYV